MNADIFRGYYDRLDEALDLISINSVWAFVFCRRQDVHTVTLVLKNNSDVERDALDKLAGIEIPRHLYDNPNGGRVGIIGLDLADKDQEFIRLYTRYKTKEEQDPNSKQFLYGTGYYLDKTGEVLGTKYYNADLDAGILDIDYFDQNDNNVNKDREIMTMDYETWGGPKALYDAVVKEKLRYNIGCKEKKDQGYFLVCPDPSFKII